MDSKTNYEVNQIINKIDKLQRDIDLIKVALNIRPHTEPILCTVVNCETLFVRTGPAKSCMDVDVLKKGDKVVLYEEVNGWCRIDEQGKRWCSGVYLKPMKSV